MARPRKNANKNFVVTSGRAHGERMRFTPSTLTNKIYKVVLRSTFNLPSDLSGKIAFVWNMNPSSTIDWSHFSTTYDEFRVIGGALNLFMNNPSTSVSHNMVAIAFDNETSVNPTAYADVANYANVVYTCTHNANNRDPFRYLFKRPTAGAPVPWLDVSSSATSTGGVRLFVDSLTNSTVYMCGAIELFVEFRGKL